MELHDPIPAVRETDAVGETAALFADLRTTLDLPFVNLIWRHLATMPGALGWTWQLLKPVYLAPALGEGADRLLRQTLPCPEIPDFAWDAAGVGPGERRAIGQLIAGYNRGNSLNLQALLVACSVLRGEYRPSATTTPIQKARPPAPPAPEDDRHAPPPRLLGLDELSPPLLALVRDFDRFGRLGDSPAIASLYRHLAHWPAFLALAYAALRPRHLDGSLKAEQERMIAAARETSVDLMGRLDPTTAGSPPESRAEILDALEQFTGLMIARMVVMGAALGALLPADERTPRG